MNVRRARQLRKKLTDTERFVWQRLRSHSVAVRYLPPHPRPLSREGRGEARGASPVGAGMVRPRSA